MSYDVQAMAVRGILDEAAFDKWMVRVDTFVWAYAGVSVYDLPDCMFRDWHEDEMPPNEAAKRAIRRA